MRSQNAKLVRELKEELEMLRGACLILCCASITTADRCLRIARVSGSSGEDVYDPKIPPEKQKVTFKAKDGTIKTVTKAELQDQLESSEETYWQSLNETWEQKNSNAPKRSKKSARRLSKSWASRSRENNVGVHTPKKVRGIVS